MKIGSVLMGMLLVAVLAAGAIPQAEREALIALYNSTDGANWEDNSNWRNAGDTDFNDPGTECTWFRVYCDVGKTTVVTLGLAFNQLSGSIPPELSNLSGLEHLNLLGNQLSGSIPPELGSLSNLIGLSLSVNQLDGSIPSSLGGLMSLEYLSLDSNELSGEIPPELGNLSNLLHLILTSNDLSGSIPSELGNLSSLTLLHLEHNQLSGSIPPELGNLLNLELLVLVNNQLSGSIPSSLGSLSNLMALALSNNQLSGSIPGELGSLSNMWLLDLSFNQLSGNIPSELGDLTSLEDLRLESNQLSGNIPSELADLSSLDDLLLESNQLSGSIPEGLRNLPDLSSISVGYNALWTNHPGLQAFLDAEDPGWDETQTVAPQSVATGAADTTSIEVSWSPIVYTGDTGGYRVLVSESSGGPYSLFDTTVDKTASGMTVTGLDLGILYYFVVQTVTEAHANNNNIVESELSSEVSESTTTPSISSPERDALIALYNSTDGANWQWSGNWRNADDTDFNDPGTECTWWRVVCDAGNLTVTKIYLRSNNLIGSIPPELGNLSNLEKLHLYDNNLTGSIPPELGNLSNLEELHLYDNNLTGSIPPELGNLSNLSKLQLYSNQLSGSIPPELGNLSNLWYLSLWANQLNGSIPPELGNLSNLIYLYLSSNQLSGSIPPELGSFPRLRRLFLASNQLSGSIPPELGNLSDLEHLLLLSNQLSGSIPPELGNLSNLVDLFLHDNQLRGSIPPALGNLSGLYELALPGNNLSGGIPPELGNISSLRKLNLSSNHLTGSIPPELGNLSNLMRLYLNSNQLSGSIPPEFGNLTRLLSTYTDIGYNALWTDDAELKAFLDTRDPDWDETQTIAPDEFSIAYVSDHTVWLEWTPIIYMDDAGGYEVFSEPVVAKAPTSGGFTPTKSTTTFPVTGLLPGQSYDFTVGTFTNPHDLNQNTVESDLTAPEMATTSDLGCSEPVVESVGNLPMTLTVVDSSFANAFEWSTGETTPSIVVNPSVSTYYWVRVFGPGSCDEATVVYVPVEVFADGFESGDTSGWSSQVP